jgi:hypothetical protein
MCVMANLWDQGLARLPLTTGSHGSKYVVPRRVDILHFYCVCLQLRNRLIELSENNAKNLELIQTAILTVVLDEENPVTMTQVRFLKYLNDFALCNLFALDLSPWFVGGLPQPLVR